MRSERRYPEPDEARDPAESYEWAEGDREEEFWEDRHEDRDPDRPSPVRVWGRALLLGAAIVGLIVLLLERLADIG